MTVFGFCIVGRGDEPLGPDKLCAEHRMVGIPPTFGRRTQQWIDGAWSPHIEKPAGYQYKPRYKDEPSAPKPVTAKRITPTIERPTHCGQCGELLTGTVRGATVQRYCSNLCKTRSSRARRTERQRAEVAS